MSVIDDMFDDDPQIMYDIEKEIAYEETIKKLMVSNNAWKELAEELGNKYDIRWCMTKCNVGANGYVHAPDCPLTKLENMKKEKK